MVVPSILRTCVLTSLMVTLLGGCQSFRGNEPKDPLIADLPSATPGVDRELPASTAAQLCAATAKSLEINGDEFGAIMLYERARLKDPKRMRSLCRRLAVLYDQTGNYQRALAEYKQALELDPKDAEMLNNLGYCHYSNGRWDLAEESLRKAVAIDPNFGRAWVNLGLTLGQKQQHNEALEAFGRVVGPAQAHSNLAFIYLTQGKKKEARMHYQRAIDLDPSLRLATVAVASIDREQSDTVIESTVAEPGANSSLTPLAQARPQSSTPPVSLPDPGMTAPSFESIGQIMPVSYEQTGPNTPLSE